MHLLHKFVKFRSHITIFVILIAICVASVISYNNNYNLVCEKINRGDAKTYIECRVSSFVQRKGDTSSFIAKVDFSDKNFLKGQSVFINAEKYKSEISKDDRINLVCNIAIADEKRNEGAFDYRDYLKSMDVVAVCSEVEIVSHTVSDSPFKKIYEIRKKIIKNCEKHIRTNNLITAVITGDRTNVDAPTEKVLKEAGVYHIVAISGLHLNLFIILIARMIAKMKKKRLVKAVISFICSALTGIFIMIFTGFGISVIRAFIMMIILNASLILPRENNSKVSLTLTAFFVLTFMPYTLWSVSWHLSFLSTFGVIVAGDIIKYLKEKFTLPKFFTGYIASTFIISLTTSIFTLPITSYVFGYVPIFAFISNALILPVMSFFMELGVVFAFVSSLGVGWISSFIGFVITALSEYIILVTKFVSSIPFNLITTYRDSFPTVLSLSVIFIWLTSIFKKAEMKKIIAFLITLSVATCSVLVYNYNDRNKLEITFAYSGQGDTTLIRVNGYNILIDSGTSQISGHTHDSVNAMLRYKNIRKIDVLIITHYHDDHTNIATDILKSGKVKTLVLPAYFDVTDEECEMIKKEILQNASYGNAEIKYVAKGSEITLGEDSHLEFLSPSNDMFLSANDMSLVSKLTYGDGKIIFFGDSQADSFRHLMNTDIECNIIKLAHHGGYANFTRDIIRKTKAKTAIVSCGVNNAYRHPAKEVVRILDEYKIDTYRTDMDGAITIIMDRKGNYKIKTVR